MHIHYVIASRLPSPWHSLKCDMTRVFHSGWPVAHHTYKDGKFETVVLGLDLAKGQQPTLNFPVGTIMCLHLTDIEGGYAQFKGEKPYVYFSEFFCPAFDYMEDYVQFEEADLPAECKAVKLPTEA